MNYVGFKNANCRPEYPGISQQLELVDQPVPTGYTQQWEHLSTRNGNFFLGKYNDLIALFQKVSNPFSGVYTSGIRDKAYFHIPVPPLPRYQPDLIRGFRYLPWTIATQDHIEQPHTGPLHTSL